MKMTAKFFFVAFYFAATLSLTACGNKEEATAAPGDFAVNVIGVKALKQDLSEKIFLVGSMAANESVDIKSEIDGVVDSVNFIEGQEVKEGAVLFQIDREKLQATYDQAKANLKLAEATAKRYEILVESKAVSRQEYDQTVATLESNRAAVMLVEEELKDAVITAPFAGTMGERLVSKGQFISKGTLLSYLISQDPMKAEFHVPERYLSEIKKGQEVKLKVAAYPNEEFKGEVYFIDPRIDLTTRTALVKAIVPNKDGRLSRGMFSNLELIVNVNPDAIVIPESALIVRGDSISVYTVDSENIVAIKTITAGKRFDGSVEVVSGLKENEIVIIEGYQKLGPGSKVNVKFEDPSVRKAYEII